jgi:hypothetical protein
MVWCHWNPRQGANDPTHQFHLRTPRSWSHSSKTMLRTMRVCCLGVSLVCGRTMWSCFLHRTPRPMCTYATRMQWMPKVCCCLVPLCSLDYRCLFIWQLEELLDAHRFIPSGSSWSPTFWHVDPWRIYAGSARTIWHWFIGVSTWMTTRKGMSLHEHYLGTLQLTLCIKQCTPEATRTPSDPSQRRKDAV